MADNHHRVQQEYDPNFARPQDHYLHDNDEYAHYPDADVEKDSAKKGSRYNDLGGTAALERVNSITTSNDYDSHDIDPDSGVKRGLKTRHLSMMALAGIIGPGL